MPYSRYNYLCMNYVTAFVLFVLYMDIVWRDKAINKWTYVYVV